MAGLIALTAVPSAATASPTSGEFRTVQSATAQPFRQLIGTVSRPTYLEASVPGAGTYLVEYEVTGVGFFNTYVNGTELGYVGGPDGTYRTRTVELSAGGHLIRVTGPDGIATARVYLVRIL